MPTFGRRDVTVTCVKSIADTRQKATLWVHDDKTPDDQQYISDLKGMCDMVTCSIRRQREHVTRLMQLKHFMETDFELLYLTDNDSFHDPSWLPALLECYDQKKLPISLYNTRSRNRVIPEPGPGFVLCDFFPGNSLLLDRNMVKTVLKEGDMKNGWEDFVALPLRAHGWNVCIPKISLVEHYGGVGSVHYKTYGVERAANPSEFLAGVRAGHLRMFYGPRADDRSKLEELRFIDRQVPIRVNIEPGCVILDDGCTIERSPNVHGALRMLSELPYGTTFSVHCA